MDHAWVCPACERKVPPTVNVCRCGHQKGATLSSAVGAIESSHAGAISASRVGATFAGAKGVIAGLAIAVLAVLGYPALNGVITEPATTDRIAIEPAKSEIARTTEPAIAPTSEAEIAPASEAKIAPAREAPIAPSADTLEDVVSRVLPAVAAIRTSRGRGTGFFIAPDRVLTNAHVVDGESSAQLTVGTSTFTARVVTVSTGTDLAILQVHNPSATQTVVRLGSASGARPGQEVIAIGSALGVLSNTVTRGIVSSVRKVGAVTMLQTDAAINPGNSGGPLVDRMGQVIGINTMGFVASRAEGVAFAVAIDHAIPLMSGRVEPSTQTPLTALSKAMDGRTEPEKAREQGEAEYAKVLEWAAQRAASLDTYWERYAPSCISRATRSGDRAWFAVLEPSGIAMEKVSAIDCEGWLDEVKDNARPVYEAVARATEAARRSGAYPGTLRDLRKRHRMEWKGWQ
jgi:S1-C subfamily serine protease